MQLVEHICLSQINFSSNFELSAPKLTNSYPGSEKELGDQFGEFCFIDKGSFNLYLKNKYLE